MDQNNSTSFCLEPLSDLRGYMAIKNGQDKSKYSLQELLKVIQDSFKIVDEIKNMIWSQNKRGNSGVSWDHSSQKIFHIPQKILHCDLRIPESRESFPGLVLKDIIHTEATRDIKEWSHLSEESVAPDTDLPGKHTAVPTMVDDINMDHTTATILSSHHAPKIRGYISSRPKRKWYVKTKMWHDKILCKQRCDVSITVNRKSKPPEVPKIILPADVDGKRRILRTKSQTFVDAVSPAPVVITTHVVVAAHTVHGTHAIEPDYTSTGFRYHSVALVYVQSVQARKAKKVVKKKPAKKAAKKPVKKKPTARKPAAKKPAAKKPAANNVASAFATGFIVADTSLPDTVQVPPEVAASAGPSVQVGAGYGGDQISHQPVSRYCGEQKSIILSKAFGAAHASTHQEDKFKNLSEIQPAFSAGNNRFLREEIVFSWAYKLLKEIEFAAYAEFTTSVFAALEVVWRAVRDISVAPIAASDQRQKK